MLKKLFLFISIIALVGCGKDAPVVLDSPTPAPPEIEVEPEPHPIVGTWKIDSIRSKVKHYDYIKDPKETYWYENSNNLALNKGELNLLENKTGEIHITASTFLPDNTSLKESTETVSWDEYLNGEVIFHWLSDSTIPHGYYSNSFVFGNANSFAILKKSYYVYNNHGTYETIFDADNIYYLTKK